MSNYRILSSSAYNVGTIVTGRFSSYNVLGSTEYIILDHVIIDETEMPPEDRFEIHISRTNGDILARLYGPFGGERGFADIMHGKTLKLVNLRYVVLGFDGREYHNTSFLFQPRDGECASGTDWHLE